MNVEKHTEREPSQEQIPTHKAVRIETDKGILIGNLVSKDGSVCTIAVDEETTEVSEDTYLVRFDQNDLQLNKPFNCTYSFDGGEIWKEDDREHLLKGVKVWERAGEVVTFSDLVDRTVNLEDFIIAIDDEAYRQYPEYEYKSEALEYAKANPEEVKFDHMFNNSDPNTGWKIHFTPQIDFVPEVMEYLKANGYRHKYLTGGSPSGGKAFTVYLGSRAMLERQAEVLEKAFGNTLLPAMAEDEEEILPGMSARFTSFEKDADGKLLFNQYGQNGMVERMVSVKSRVSQKQFDIDSDTKRKIAEESYKALSKRYGSYFHG